MRIRELGSLGIAFVICLFLVFYLSNSAESEGTGEAHTKAGLSFFTPTINKSDVRYFEPWLDEESGNYYVFAPSNGKTLYLALKSGETVEIDGEIYSAGQRFKYKENVEYSASAGGKQFTLIFLRSDNIAAAYIDTESGSLEDIWEDKEYKEAGSMLLIDAKGKVKYSGALESISGRGNDSWWQEKRPYNLKLDYSAKLVGTAKSKKWALIAGADDESFLRNKLILDMSAEADMGFAPQSEIINVYINGQYEGLYQLCQRIEVGEDAIDITDTDKVNKELNDPEIYENIEDYHAETEDKRYYNLPESLDPSISGFVIERVVNAGYFVSESGFILDSLSSFVFKEPKYASSQQVDYMQGVLQSLENAITSGDGIDHASGKRLEEIIDLDSWVKLYLLDEISMNFDSSGNGSYFLYKDSDTSSELLFAGPAWDYDHSLGNSLDSTNGQMVLYANQRTRWGRWLYNTPVFKARVPEIYETVFLPIIEDFAESRIDAEIDRIEKATAMDYIRWNYEEKKRYAWFDDINSQRKYVKKFLTERMDFLSSVWLEGKKLHRVKYKWRYFGDKYYSVEHGERLDAIFIPPDEEGKVFVCWVDAGTGRPIDLTRPIYRDIVVEAVWEEAGEWTQIESIEMS